MRSDEVDWRSLRSVERFFQLQTVSFGIALAARSVLRTPLRLNVVDRPSGEAGRRMILNWFRGAITSAASAKFGLTDAKIVTAIKESFEKIPAYPKDSRNSFLVLLNALQVTANSSASLNHLTQSRIASICLNILYNSFNINFSYPCYHSFHIYVLIL